MEFFDEEIAEPAQIHELIAVAQKLSPVDLNLLLSIATRLANNTD